MSRFREWARGAWASLASLFSPPTKPWPVESTSTNYTVDVVPVDKKEYPLVTVLTATSSMQRFFDAKLKSYVGSAGVPFLTPGDVRATFPASIAKLLALRFRNGQYDNQVQVAYSETQAHGAVFEHLPTGYQVRFHVDKVIETLMTAVQPYQHDMEAYQAATDEAMASLEPQFISHINVLPIAATELEWRAAQLVKSLRTLPPDRQAAHATYVLQMAGPDLAKAFDTALSARAEIPVEEPPTEEEEEPCEDEDSSDS